MLFGGARGGGKTDGVLGKFAIKGEVYGKHFNAVFFRREMPQADDLIERAKEIYCGIGATWYEQKKMFRLPSGGRVRFRPLDNEQDAEKYQGQNVSDAAVEEAGNYPDSGPIDKLFGALRSVAGVPIQLILTANPGGRGHKWLKDRYIRPHPMGMVPLTRKLGNGKDHKYLYIPSRVTNNRLLIENDPGYIDRLHLVGSPELVRAWLEGDWEIMEGAYYPEFGGRHICAPFSIPRHWPRYFGFDWGYASPFCALWSAVSSGKDDSGKEVYIHDATGNRVHVPKGCLVVYRERTDTRKDNSEIKQIVMAACGYDGTPNQTWMEELGYPAADPSIFKHDGGESIAEQIGLGFRRADNDRLSGWAQIRLRLKAKEPMLLISTACPYLKDSLQALPADPKHPEDVDTTSDDHAADALRYICKERVLTTEYKPEIKPVSMGRVDLGAYIQKIRGDRNRPKI